MGLKPFQTDTVVVGRFNPHIIIPPWLVKEQIVSDTDSIEPDIEITGQNVVVGFKGGGFTWRVDFSRLVLLTDTMANTAAKVAEVLAKLPHTPVTALGNNFRYRCSMSSWRGGLPMLGTVGIDQLKREGEVLGLVWRAVVARPDGLTLNAEVSLEPSVSAPDIVVVLNYHREIRDASEVTAIEKHFQRERDFSIEFIESLGETVDL